MKPLCILKNILIIAIIESLIYIGIIQNVLYAYPIKFLQ